VVIDRTGPGRSYLKDLVNDLSPCYKSDNVEDKDGATAQDIIDQFGWMTYQDILIYLGHGVANEKGELVAIAGEDKPAYIADDLLKALQNAKQKMGKRNREMMGAGLLILAGCEGCQRAQEFVDAGVKCVVCFNNEVAVGIASQFVRDMVSEMMKGDTIDQAFKKTRDGSPTVREKAELKCKDNAARGKKCKKNVGLQ